MRILITGGAGFIGSHLADYLVKLDHEVTLLDDLSTGEYFNIVGHSLVRADVRNFSVLDRLASETDYIVHLAAKVGVKWVVEHPVATIKENISGTEAVLEAALRYQVPVLIASSSEVYGKNSKIPFEEDDDLTLGSSSKSRWSYATSKLVDEHLALAYRREFSLDVKIIRFFNIVGPRQRPEFGMVLPSFIDAAKKDEPIVVYGDGSQRRVFLHIYDCVRAISKLLSPQKYNVFNVGGVSEVTMLELANRVKEILSSSSEIVVKPYEEVYPRGFEDMPRRVPSLARLQECLDWAPRYSLDEMIEHSFLGFEMRAERNDKPGFVGRTKRNE